MHTIQGRLIRRKSLTPRRAELQKTQEQSSGGSAAGHRGPQVWRRASLLDTTFKAEMNEQDISDTGHSKSTRTETGRFQNQDKRLLYARF